MGVFIIYFRITDFGGSKFFKEDNAEDYMTKGVGTSVYMVFLLFYYPSLFNYLFILVSGGS